jgi:prophage regulatory protein
MSEQLLRWKAVSLKTGLSRPTIWRAVRQGRFPRPLQLTSPSCVAWLASEIESWIAARVAQRDQQEPRRSPVSRGRPRKVAAGT